MNFASKKPMILSFIAGGLALLISSCTATHSPEAAKVTLDQAIVGAAASLTKAEKQITGHYKTFNLRPSKATVSFDLSTVQESANKAELNVSTPVGGGSTGGLLGWSATKRIEKGNHIEIEFTPKNK